VADLFLMVGLPGAGKTTYAQKLAKETGAVRFTPDEWHIFLFGDDFHQVEQEIHDSRHNRVEDLMWKVGQDLLQKGVSVILDFGFWVEEQREEKRLEAAALGAETKVCFLDTPLERSCCAVWSAAPPRTGTTYFPPSQRRICRHGPGCSNRL